MNDVFRPDHRRECPRSVINHPLEDVAQGQITVINRDVLTRRKNPTMEQRLWHPACPKPGNGHTNVKGDSHPWTRKLLAQIHGRSRMGIVMIQCPATGRAISTGIAVDRWRALLWIRSSLTKLGPRWRIGRIRPPGGALAPA